jgi:hypothetical protein
MRKTSRKIKKGSENKKRKIGDDETRSLFKSQNVRER